MGESTTETWYREARVRRGASGHRLTREGALFAPELAPHASHPIVQRAGAVDALLRGALVRYLHATSVLEVRVVNVVAAELAHGAPFFEVTREARIEALTILCDEAYHALASSDLLAQLGADEAREPEPAFLARMRALLRDEPRPEVLRFLFTVVTETAISRSLARLSRDRRVTPALRAFVAEHAIDEARHHAFFARLFVSFWSQLDAVDRRALGERLPELVVAYLTPDLAGVGRDLASVGLSRGEIDEVIAEAYPPSAIADAVLDGARPVLATFHRAGALREHQGAFGSFGLSLPFTTR